MAHNVICTICNQKFDRDKKNYAITGSRRYAHAECALRKAQETNKTPPDIIYPLDIVKCNYCGKTLNKRIDEHKFINSKFFHIECFALENSREKTDEEILNDYIMEITKTDYVSPRIKKQIKTYMEDFNFSYSGIYKTLKYWIEVKQRTITNTLGIVPYIYNDAYNYYHNIWLAKQKNKDKEINSFQPKQIEIHINSPQRNIKKRKLFKFLDKEE